MDPLLATAGGLALLMGFAHSILGERYILRRLFRRPLPPLFGHDVFTRRTVRFAWHVTSLAWWGMGLILILLGRGPLDEGGRLAARAVAVTFAASGLYVLVASRGRHLAWLVMLAIAALAWLAT